MEKSIASRCSLRYESIVGPRANGLSCFWRKRRERFGEKVHTWVPLPREGTHHAVIGTLHPDPQHVLSWLLGDGMVHVASARAQSYRDAPVFPAERVTIVGGVGHLGLPRSARVYPAILAALTGRAGRRRRRA